MTAADPASPRYSEQLTVPASWWAADVSFALASGWVVLVAAGTTAGAVTFGVVLALTTALVAVYGALRLEVTTAVVAGTAFVGPPHLGAVDVLDAAAYRHLLGPGANARAHLVTRPWIREGVKLTLNDPTDPTPYWVLGSRRPEALAAAIRAIGQTETRADPAEGRSDDDGGR